MILIRLGLIVDVPRYELVACVFYFRNVVGRSTSLAHLWSLSLEEQFYGLWPLLIGRVKSVRRMLIYAATLTALISIARMIAIESRHFDYNTGITYVRPWFRFDSILIGCCIALARAQSEVSASAFEISSRTTASLVGVVSPVRLDSLGRAGFHRLVSHASDAAVRPGPDPTGFGADAGPILVIL
jgi:peptidoglycan/LPS O-acetylase OafA/YrhL